MDDPIKRQLELRLAGMPDDVDWREPRELARECAALRRLCAFCEQYMKRPSRFLSDIQDQDEYVAARTQVKAAAEGQPVAFGEPAGEEKANG